MHSSEKNHQKINNNIQAIPVTIFRNAGKLFGVVDRKNLAINDDNKSDSR